MHTKQIKLVIPSELENVALIGGVTSKLCSLVPFSDYESFQIELCVVEAVNNSIVHAYQKQKGNEVEVLFTIHTDRIICDVCDTGSPMDHHLLEQACEAQLEIDVNNIGNVPESGRGLPIMKTIMDNMTYKTVNGKNCLTMIKKRSN